MERECKGKTKCRPLRLASSNHDYTNRDLIIAVACFRAFIKDYLKYGLSNLHINQFLAFALLII